MTALLDKAAGWLTPQRRRAIYGLLSLLGGLLVAFGVVTDSVVTGWLGLAGAVLSVAALVLASWKARRADWTVIYGAMAALVTALKVAGIVNDGQESHVLDTLAALMAAMPLVAATMRTSPATPTGEPVEEYAPEHAAPEGNP